MRLLESTLALIQLTALVIIGYASFAPSYWRGANSDLEATIHRGGDYAVEQWLSSEQRESQSLRRWGIGIGATSFVLATAAIIAARNRNNQD